jgi:HAMP domain-containing protein
MKRAQKQWKDGAMSKYKTIVPTRMQRILNDLADNPDWIRSKDEILLLEARVIELLQQLHSGGTSEAIKKSRELTEQIFEAIASEDGDKAHEGLLELRSVLAAGDATSSEIWKEIQETLSERRRTVEQERRVIETATNVLRPDEIIWLATRIAAISRKHLSEEQWPEFTRELEDLIMLREQPKKHEPITSRLEAVIEQGIVERELIDVGDKENTKNLT